MCRNDAIRLGNHLDGLVDTRVEAVRYGYSCEVHVGLPSLEAQESADKALQEALKAGEESGQPEPFDPALFLQRMHGLRPIIST